MAKKTLLVECSTGLAPAESVVKEWNQRFIRLGAQPVPGYQPVPMSSEDPEQSTIVFSVQIDDEAIQAQLTNMTGVVQVYGAPEIEPFDEGEFGMDER